MTATTAGVAGGLLTAGTIGAVIGFAGALFRWNVVHDLRSTLGGDTSATLPNDGEATAVVGTVSGTPSAGSAPKAPSLDEDPAVLVVWKLEMYRGTSKKHRGWHTVATGISGVPFLVDDGSEEALIVPKEHVWKDNGFFRPGGRLLCYTEGAVANDAIADVGAFDGELTWGADDPTPESIGTFVQETAEDMEDIFGLLSLSDADAKRRYREAYVRTGDDVVVRGTVKTAGGKTAIVPSNNRSLFVSTRDPDEVRSTLRSRYLKWGGFGLASVLLVAGLLAF